MLLFTKGKESLQKVVKSMTQQRTNKGRNIIIVTYEKLRNVIKILPIRKQYVHDFVDHQGFQL